MIRYGGLVIAICTQACGYSPVRAAAAAENHGTQKLCVLRGTDLVNIDINLDERTGDTLITGAPISEVYPIGSPPYARGMEWFVRQEPLIFRDRRFVPYATPRTIAPDLLAHIGEYRGVPLFSERGTGQPAEIMYIPVRPGCEFQQYVVQAPY